MDLALTLTIVFGIVTVITAVVGVIAWIASSRSVKRLRQEVRDGFVAISKGETPVYQGGLPELEDKKKLVLIRNGFKAMRKFKHNKAIKKFQKALTRASDPSERCALLNLIGLSQRRKGDNREAEQTLLEMIEIAERAGLDEALAVGLGNIGTVHYSLEKPRNALEYYEKSLRVAEQIGNTKIQAQMHGNIGITYATLDEPQKALDYQQIALELAKKIGNEEIRAKALCNIGIVYNTLGKSDKAFECLEKALELDQKTGNLEGQAQDLGNIGAVYGNMEDHQKAIEHFKRARVIFVKIGAKDKVELCDRGIARAEEAMKK